MPEDAAFPDNWIYVHSPDVRLGRVQNFGAWSPFMVKPGSTCLGLEYFVNERDDLWDMADDELSRSPPRSCARSGCSSRAWSPPGTSTRVPKAYPVYDGEYAANVATMRAWLSDHATNVHPVGRNGMHRYNNQDHSMLTAMLAVENILDDAGHDLWSVNVDEEYHEQRSDVGAVAFGGRAAPITA